MSSVQSLDEAVAQLAAKRGETLDWSGRDARKLPNHLWKAKTLVHLWLSDNQLTSLPTEICHLKSLQQLWLQNNQIEDLPEDMGSLNELTSFWLSNNKLKDMAMPISLPLSLVDLQLSDNQLTKWPNCIFALTNLTKLALAGNHLQRVENNIGRLTKLEVLELNGNKIATMASGVAQLQRLSTLWLHNNQLTTLPNVLCDLTSLRDLSLGGNQLKDLDFDLSQLRVLETLDVSNNKLTRLPESLFSLGPSLTSLDISDNQLYAMSPLLTRLTALSDLQTTGNEWTNITDSLMSKRGKSLIKHFSTKDIAGNRAKVVFLGERFVGKTSLLKSIISSDKKSKSVDLSFDSKFCKIYRWKCRTEQRRIDVSMWDFPGNSGYADTFQFVLTDHTIVVLVFDMSRPLKESKLLQWMSSIRARTSKAPVLLFGTHNDDESFTEEILKKQCAEVLQTIGGRFSLITHVADVDARSPESASALREALSSIIVRCPTTTRVVPNSYVALEASLMRERSIVPLVFSEGFRRLCGRHSIVSDHDIHEAASYMHSTGSLLHFNVPTGQLHTLYILDPSFLLRAVHLLLNPPTQTFIKQGVLKHFDLFLLWNDVPADTYTPLLALVEHFELCFRLRCVEDISFDDGESLFPAFLDDKPLLISDTSGKAPIPPRQVFARIYYFPLVYPKDLFAHVLVRSLRCADQAQGWTVRHTRQGLLLSRGDDEALVTTDASRQRLLVEARGLNPSRLLVLLLDIVDTSLLDWYPELLYEVAVPCSHCQALGRWPPRFFDVHNAEAALRAGRAALSCSHSANSVGEPAEWLADVKLQFWQTPSLPVSTESSVPIGYNGLLRSCEAVPLGSSLAKASETPPLTPSSSASVPLAVLVPDLCLVGFLTVDESAIHYEKQLGGGLHTAVYAATLNGEPVAVKKLTELADGETASRRRSHERNMAAQANEFRRECALLGDLTHPNIIELKGICLSPLCMITSLEPLGDLAHYLGREETILSHWQCLWLASDVTAAVVYLQSLTPPILHRDLKSPNVLLREGDGRVLARLGDLGLSRVLMSGMVERTVDNPRWLAPEVLIGRAYTLAADLYSVGLVCWELFARQLPFAEYSYRFDSRLEDAIIGGLRPTMPNDIPPAMSLLIEELTHHEPTKRPVATEVQRRLTEMLTAGDVLTGRYARTPLRRAQRRPLLMALDVPSLPLERVNERRHRRLQQGRRRKRHFQRDLDGVSTTTNTMDDDIDDSEFSSFYSESRSASSSAPLPASLMQTLSSEKSHVDFSDKLTTMSTEKSSSGRSSMDKSAPEKSSTDKSFSEKSSSHSSSSSRRLKRSSDDTESSRGGHRSRSALRKGSESSPSLRKASESAPSVRKASFSSSSAHTLSKSLDLRANSHSPRSALSLSLPSDEQRRKLRAESSFTESEGLSDSSKKKHRKTRSVSSSSFKRGKSRKVLK